MSGIYTLLSAGKGQQRRLEATSNNLANVNTPAYKGDQAIFREELSKVIGQDLESEEEDFVHHEFLSPFSRGGNSYVKIDEVVPNMQKGVFRHTENPLDLALNSTGYFVADTPQGRRYTRDGNFTLDQSHFLINQNGHRILGEDGPLQLKGDKIDFGVDGSVFVDGKEVGQVSVVSFSNESKLNKMGGNYWAPSSSEQQPTRATSISLQQGVLEGANVNSVNEMVNLITINREFEATQKALRSIDELDEKSVSLSQV